VAAVAYDGPRFVDAGPPRSHARERLAEIRERIQAALRYPPTARERAIEGTTWLRFELDRAGNPLRVEVHRSSGRPSLDRAASGAVTAAAPLPWVYGRLEVPVLFALERRK
jgi:protein TonB